MSRLIIISNRLPFSIDTQSDDIRLRQSSGGLVSALKSYFERTREKEYSDRIWMGSMDGTAKEWQLLKEDGQIPEDFIIEPIFPEPHTYKNFYNGFSNSTLWPLFHYFPSLVEYKKEYFEDFKKINQLFADRIFQIYQPG